MSENVEALTNLMKVVAACSAFGAFLLIAYMCLREYREKFKLKIELEEKNIEDNIKNLSLPDLVKHNNKSRRDDDPSGKPGT